MTRMSLDERGGAYAILFLVNLRNKITSQQLCCMASSLVRSMLQVDDQQYVILSFVITGVWFEVPGACARVKCYLLMVVL